MTRTLAAVVALGLLAGSLVALDDPPSSQNPVAALIAQLGHDDYALREDAEKQLGELGPDALPALREAAAGENPEVSRRAGRALQRITRRLDNEKLLVPKLVALNAENVGLDALLADLSKQSGYDVITAGPNAGSPALRRYAVKTGTVPFWQAVLAVCDAADLKIASVGGFLASDAGQPLAAPRAPTSRPPVTATSVVLEPRGNAKRRPATVCGAVCVEAVPVPASVATPAASVAILQVWPEPGLQWHSASAVRLNVATDDVGQARLVEPSGPVLASPQVVRGNNVVVVKQVNGGVVLVNPNARVPSDAAASPNFTPSPRQFVVKFKPAPRPARMLGDFRGTLFGTIRVGPEAMITLTDLTSGQVAEGSHLGGANLRATFRKDADGKWRALVELSYDTTKVQPADSSSKLGNIVYGLRATDPNGNAYLTVPTSMAQTVRGGSTRQTMRIDCELHPAKLQSGPPTSLAFWATFGKSVEVPFALADVPVAGGAE